MAEQPKEDVKKKSKRPTALKRNIQSVKCNQRNRSFKARVATCVRSFKEILPKKDKAAAQTKLNEVCSLLDKGVKKGVFKLNKARRIKSQMTGLATTK